MNYSDIDIIRRIKQGDQNVFRTIYDIYYQRMKLYAESYVDDPDAAEDIVQDLLFNLWTKRQEIDIVTSLSSYLYRAIHNRCIQHLRHKKVIARYQDKHLLKIKEVEIMAESGFDFSFNEIEDIKERIFSTLSPKTKKIFQLSRNEDKNNKEIADTMDLSVKSVEYHITKALKSFQLALKDYILLFLITISCFIW
jgi:RNA polymerase sigma-70 factor, ECF subfamily